MEQTKFSRPISLKRIAVQEGFWKEEMELVRKEVIPYQWETLNDRVEDASPSFCMRNFKVAGKMMKEKRSLGSNFEEPVYTYRGFETLPEDMDHLEDKFYGFVFQDSDFAKWIEAVGYSLTQHPDEKLEAIADEAIDIVCAAQHPSGYLDSYYIINGMDKIFSNLRDHHELYCLGHLVEGAIAYYEATGKDKLLKAAERYVDFVADYFGEEEGKCKGYPGHEIAEMALLRLYETTGKDTYLKLAMFFLNQRGQRPYYFDSEHHEIGSDKIKNLEEERYHYQQAHVPVRDQKEAVGHAVRAVYLYSGMADGARLTQDESLYQACEILWNSIVNEKMYVTGGIGGTHIGESFSFPYDLPNDTAYAETCASIGLIFFARRMLQIKPDSRYADVMERALYNGVLSGMALDGKSFFYVNPLQVNPEACRKDERKHHVKAVRQKWFGCACCPPNLARLLTSIGAYSYTETDDTLFVHLYTGGTVQKQIGDTQVTIEITSAFPWSGEVTLGVNKDVQMTIALRIPDWCSDFKLEEMKWSDLIEKNILLRNNELYAEQKDGYLYLTGAWKANQPISMNFAMEPVLLAADSKVSEDEGMAALQCGPLVYCLEQADNGAALGLCRITEETTFTPVWMNIQGNSVKAWIGNGLRRQPVKQQGLYHVLTKPVYEFANLVWIPYYAWANRGEGEMQVWTKVR
ncbi:MAG: glycoside hydrolase family 127 protein [Lachnospiraceae bacterium]